METLTERQKLVESEIRKYRIDEGAHGAESFAMKTACIMEAICLVLGYDPDDAKQLSGYLNPPCISKEIRTILVTINDTIRNNSQRSALKSLAPLILNTAPTYRKVTEFKTKPNRIEQKQDKNNSDYRDAEKERRRLIREAGFTGPDAYENTIAFLYSGETFNKKKTLDFIKSLIDVAKFENGALVTE